MRLTAIIVALLLFLSSAADAKTRKPVTTKKMTVAAKRERTELLLPRVTVSADGRVLPDLRAAAAIVYDPATQEVLYESNANETRPIASITKVMTASVYMETEPNLNQIVTVQSSDTAGASHTYLRANDKVTVDDLMHLLLIASDNAAARVLARTSKYGSIGFVERMNEKAPQLGLMRTTYADPSGLLRTNSSTAFDMARLIFNVSSDPYISGIMQIAEYSFRTVAKRLVSFRTTDHLLVHNVPVMAAKTGFTNPAGFCLASLLKLPSAQTIAIVVLGARSNAERFIEVENLYQWFVLHQKVSSLQVEDVFPAVHMSERGMAFIKHTEQDHFRETAYYDSNGWAIGYGMHRWQGQRVTKRYPGRITPEQADTEFRTQLAHYEQVVNASIAAPLSQSAYDALVSVAYNLGRVNTDIINKLTAGKGVSPGDFLSTATVRGRPVGGLETRRLREFVMFAGDYTGALLAR